MPLFEITNAHSLRAPFPLLPYHVNDSCISFASPWKSSLGNLQKHSFKIKAVAATVEPKTLPLPPKSDKCKNDLQIGVLLQFPEQEEELDEREKLRRFRISKANKGNTPWNKGRKHTPETLRKIRERTRLAMQNPKVKMKLTNLGHAQTTETKLKIGAGVRKLWERRRGRKMVQESCCFEWQNLIAEASRKGHVDQEELQWNSYEILNEQLKQEWSVSVEQRKQMVRAPVSNRAPKSPEQRRKIAEAIAAKWADPTTLRVLAGNDELLLNVIPILLGCKAKNNAEGNFIESTVVPELTNLLKTEFSHLMEVVLEVSPEALFNELFTKLFKNSLFELSSHQHGNFVVQALISHTSSQDLMELIWEELKPNMKGLLQMGRSGVVASLIAACERLHINEYECCQVLAKTVCLADESPKWVVPRLLCLDSYFTCEDKSNWIWQSGAKMNVMGSLILQTVFRFGSEYIKPYITSITSMEETLVLEAVKDARGSHVIESFLCSGAPGKQKRRLVAKLQRHFGEVALHSSGAFTIEKCFTACNLSLREAIVSEILAVRSEIAKTKQGSYLLRKLDVDGFAANPDHWRSKQVSKESTYKDFYATFGSSDTKSTKHDGFLADTSNNKSNPKAVKEMRKEIDQSLGSAASFLSMDGFKRNSKKEKQKNKKIDQISGDDDNTSRKNKKSKKEKVESENDIAANAVARKNAKKRQRNGDTSEASGKKLKASD